MNNMYYDISVVIIEQKLKIDTFPALFLWGLTLMSEILALL